MGAGQLARMAGEAASALGLSLAVLAKRPDDAACDVAAEVIPGSPLVEAEFRALADQCRVVTFDHEQVDLGIVASLVAEGRTIYPGVATLELAVDKSRMRAALVAAGVAVPAFLVIEQGPDTDAAAAVADFASTHGWPIILKTARGGYDGKGVWTVEDEAA
ncbi:MAG TPA: hypothetical protein VGH31_00900, partial [Acidimicrobiales bacterium]